MQSSAGALQARTQPRDWLPGLLLRVTYRIHLDPTRGTTNLSQEDIKDRPTDGPKRFESIHEPKAAKMLIGRIPLTDS